MVISLDSRATEARVEVVQGALVHCGSGVGAVDVVNWAGRGEEAEVDGPGERVELGVESLDAPVVLLVLWLSWDKLHGGNADDRLREWLANVRIQGGWVDLRS